MTTELLFIVHIVLFALILNFVRFKLSNLTNRLLVVGGAFYLFSSATYFFDTVYLSLLFVFIIASTLAFNQKGALLSSSFSFLILSFYEKAFSIENLVLFFLIGTIMYTLSSKLKHFFTLNQLWKNLLIKNSKQLNVIREVSIAMQQTRERDKILHIIMTSVTAGHGLGFNRAIAFLYDSDSNRLKGIMGIGPLNSKEGFKKWKDIAKQKYRLIDLISLSDSQIIDPKLNDIVRSLTLPLTEDHFLTKTLESGQPLHIVATDHQDQGINLFIETFQMKELVAVPLLNQGTKVGILIVDNPVTLKSITEEEIDSILPLASQAAIAIQQAKLYQEIEQMALKDGLTGLWNQRALQSKLEDYFPTDQGKLVSMIMIDIDFFKRFNDTHGHMIGNDVLEQLALVITGSIRSEDLAFRFGGEEFSILIPHTSASEACLIAERIRMNVESSYFKHQETQPNQTITVTLGVACSDQLDSKTPKALINAADQALYLGKESGKNKVTCYKGNQQ